jgi:O6-methylguanine-DNA--protein-cysteine methyltransferase
LGLGDGGDGTAEAQDALGDNADGTDAAAEQISDDLTDAEADRLLTEYIASQFDTPQHTTDVDGKVEPKPEAKAEAKPAPTPSTTTTPSPEIEEMYQAVEDELSEHAAKAFRSLVDGLRTQIDQMRSERTAEREAAQATRQYLAWKRETLPAVEHIDKLMEGDPRFGLAAKLARDEVTAEQFQPYQVLHKLAMGIQEQAKREGRELSAEAVAKAAASRMRRMHGQKPIVAQPTQKPKESKPGKLNLPAPKQPAKNEPTRDESEAEFLRGLRGSLRTLTV